MYRQDEDGLTPGQLKKIRTRTDRTIKGQLRRQPCRLPFYRSCALEKSGISPAYL